MLQQHVHLLVKLQLDEVHLQVLKLTAIDLVKSLVTISNLLNFSNIVVSFSDLSVASIFFTGTETFSNFEVQRDAWILRLLDQERLKTILKKIKLWFD